MNFEGFLNFHGKLKVGLLLELLFDEVNPDD
jgi:hypothetical protein